MINENEIIQAYGISLRKLTRKDLEMVRVWRNSEIVAEHMITRKKISPEQQTKWFEGIKKRNEIHFIIGFEGRDVGLISLKNIDFEQNNFEPALYIAARDLHNSHVPFLASFCLGDYIHEHLGLANPRIYVSDDNKKAIKYNKFLGFRPSDVVIKEKFRLYTLDTQLYDKARSKILRILNLKQ